MEQSDIVSGNTPGRIYVCVCMCVCVWGGVTLNNQRMVAMNLAIACFGDDVVAVHSTHHDHTITHLRDVCLTSVTQTKKDANFCARFLFRGLINIQAESSPL